MSKSFLAVGNHLINPDLLAYATVESDGEEPRLRLGFASGFADSGGELRLVGEPAREVLRWLRLNATFLTRAGGFGAIGSQAEPPVERESRITPRNAPALTGNRWGPLEVSDPEPAPSLFGRTRAPV